MAKLLVGKEDVKLEDGKFAKVEYYILKERIFYDELNIETVTYGIEIDKKDEDQLEFDFLRDITTEEDEIKKLIKLIMKNKVMPVHLKDVMEDLI